MELCSTDMLTGRGWEREEKWARYYCQFTNHLKLEHLKGAILLCALVLWVGTSHRAQCWGSWLGRLEGNGR